MSSGEGGGGRGVDLDVVVVGRSFMRKATMTRQQHAFSLSVLV